MSVPYWNENGRSHGYLLPCAKNTPSHMGLQLIVSSITGISLCTNVDLNLIIVDQLRFEPLSPEPKVAMLPLCYAPLTICLVLSFSWFKKRHVGCFVPSLEICCNLFVQGFLITKHSKKNK